MLRLSNGAVLGIGPRPPQGTAVVRSGFSMLVLTADTYQPPISAFPGVCVIRVGVPDDRRKGLTAAEREKIVAASKHAAKHLAGGYNALFTCEMGLNRSALCATLTLVRLGMPRSHAVAVVRRMRGAVALNNQKFVDIISTEPISQVR
jgi:protein-tyrosine phosphatase